MYRSSCFLWLLLAPWFAGAQSVALFESKKISSISVTIPVDSLKKIYDNPYLDYYFKAQFVYDDGLQRDSVADIGMRLRGNTSRAAEKKSFKISFNEFVAGRKYQGVKKINLNGQHNDPSLIREKLFYDLWKSAGMPERRTAFVKLFINQKYYGLYTILEEFDKDWLKRVYAENDGNLYKCTYPADLVYKDNNPETYKKIQSSTVTGGRAYDLQTNETADDYRDLVRMIDVLDKPSNSQAFIDSVQKIVDVNVFLKALALDVATGNWDDYAYNKNNYFLYHSGTDDRMKFITYDTDNCAGIDWIGKDWATRNCLSWIGSPRPLASKLLAVPQFKKRYAQYLDTIARTLIAPSIIFPKIDSMRNLIVSAALQDSFRTLDYGFDTGDFFDSYTTKVVGHAPYGVKPFFEIRATKILEQINSLVSIVEKPLAESLQLELFPNPATNKLNIRFGSEINEINILTIDGAKIKQSIDLQQNVIDIADLPVGQYILQVRAKNGKSVTRIFQKE